MVYYRLANSRNEHHTLLDELHRHEGSLTVHKASASTSTPAPALSLSDLDQQYTTLMGTLELISWPYVLAILSICGESNAPLAADLLQALGRWRSLPMVKEMKLTTVECNKAAKEAIQNAFNLRFPMNTCKKSAGSGSDELAFIADLVYGQYVLLLTAPPSTLQSAGILGAGMTLSLPLGRLFFQTLQCLYEVLVPLADASANHERIEQIRGYCLLAGCLLLRHCSRLPGDDDGLSWLEIWSSPLVLQDCICGINIQQERMFTAGLFVSDLIKYSKRADRSIIEDRDVRRLVQHVLGLDELGGRECTENIDYFLSSLQISETALPAATSPVQAPTVVSSSAPVAEPVKVNQQESLDSIQAIFPDLGTGFVEACLQYYSNPEQAIDALLMDNLPPHLRGLDRGLQRVTQGKSSLMQSTSAIVQPSKLNANAMEYKAYVNTENKQNKAFLAKQKEIVKEMEAAQRADAMLLREQVQADANEDLEYNDDYDDQVSICRCFVHANVLTVCVV